MSIGVEVAACMFRPPARSAPNCSAASTTPSGLARPSRATVMASKPSPPGEVWRQAELDAEHLPGAGEPGQRAGQDHGQHGGPADVDAGGARRRRVGAGGAELEPPGAAAEQPGDGHRGQQRHDDAGVQPQPLAGQVGQAGRHGHDLGDRVDPAGPPEGRAGEQVQGQVEGHVVQHDGGDDLVRPGGRLDDAGDEAPRRPAREPGQQRQRQVHEHRQAMDREAHVPGHQPAGDHLPLGADVEQPRPEPEGDPEAREHQRRGRHDRLGQRAAAADRAGEQRPVRRRDGVPGGGQRVAGGGEEVAPGRQHALVGEHDQHGAHHQGREDRQQRHQHRARAGQLLEEAGGEGAAGWPGRLGDLWRLDGRLGQLEATSPWAPAISRPISSRSAPPGRSPTMWPRNMTRMRSASAITSSSSEETISTASPWSRASTMRRWTYSIEPTSRPRVGCEAISSRIGRDSSLAMITFCWLPPDRLLTWTSTEGVRMSNSLARSTADACTAPVSITGPRANGAVSYFFINESATTEKLAIRPSLMRSSGTWATPERSTERGLAWCRCRPARVMEPASDGARPGSASTSSVWPLPCTPAIATISPARTCSDTSSTARWPRSSRTVRPSTCRTSSPGVASSLATCSSTERPTIIDASSCSLVSSGTVEPTTLPLRSTVMRSAIGRTSFSLWVMNSTEWPDFWSDRMIENRSSVSCGVSTAVGSSRISSRASRSSALMISTRCWTPTGRSSTIASGSTTRPKRCESSRTSRLAVARSSIPARRIGSIPRTAFSATVNTGTSMKCWWTMPMPAAIASAGLFKRTGWSSMRISPSSAWYSP